MKSKIFNKKNLLRFADNLYKDDGEYEHYMPLCHGTLAKTNANGEITHRAIGKMYEYFVGKKIACKVVCKKVVHREVCWNTFDDIVIIKEDNIVIFMTEDTAINKILSMANKPFKEYETYLFRITPCVNDKVIGNDEKALIKRAKTIQKHLYEVAKEL